MANILKQPPSGDASTKYVKIKPMKLFMPNTRLVSGPLETASPKVMSNRNASTRGDNRFSNIENSPHDSYSVKKKVEGIIGSGLLTLKY